MTLNLKAIGDFGPTITNVRACNYLLPAMSDFKDNFSKQADIYVKYRPHYPRALYTYLASLTNAHDLAWDCGTGNGQAAIDLAAHYKQVLATDPSKEQIEHCLPHQKVKYKIERSEASSLAANSVDLVTVANALHWFDHRVFFNEVKRVLKKDGVFAAWAYGTPRVTPEIDKVTAQLHDEVLNDYWLFENRLVEKEYNTIQFPFETMTTPNFFSEKTMTLEDFMGFLDTWSAVQRFIRENAVNPVDRLKSALEKAWTGAAVKTIKWKLVLKVGRPNQ